MSGTAKRRNAKKRQQFYRSAAVRTDRNGRCARRFYGDQVAKAQRLVRYRKSEPGNLETSR